MVRIVRNIIIEIMINFTFILCSIPFWQMMRNESMESIAMSYNDFAIENISCYIKEKNNNEYTLNVINQTNNIKKYNLYFIDKENNTRLIKTDYIKENSEDSFKVVDNINNSVNIILEEV